MIKKIVIDFDIIEFENHLKKYDYANCIDVFYNALQLQKSSVNNLNLSPIKLAEVLERDTTRLKAMQDEFRKLQPIEKPIKEDFQTYAETPAEIDRFNDSINLLKILEKFKQYGINPNIFFNRAFNDLITFDLVSNEIKYNVNFIKKGI